MSLGHTGENARKSSASEAVEFLFSIAGDNNITA
jgi:ethanolamine utilization protein EutA (predicted chaperonin)